MEKGISKLIFGFLLLFLAITAVACNNVEKLDDTENSFKTESLDLTKESNVDSPNVPGGNILDEAQEEIEDIWANVKPLCEKIYWNGSIEEPFDDSSFIITIDIAFTNKVFTIDDFKDLGLDIIEVRWLTKVDRFAEDNSWPEDWHQMYSIRIANKGKQNIIDAIMVVRELDFVMRANPNHIVSLNLPYDFNKEIPKKD